MTENEHRVADKGTESQAADGDVAASHCNPTRQFIDCMTVSVCLSIPGTRREREQSVYGGLKVEATKNHPVRFYRQPTGPQLVLMPTHYLPPYCLARVRLNAGTDGLARTRYNACLAKSVTRSPCPVVWHHEGRDQIENGTRYHLALDHVQTDTIICKLDVQTTCKSYRVTMWC